MRSSSGTVCAGGDLASCESDIRLSIAGEGRGQRCACVEMKKYAKTAFEIEMRLPLVSNTACLCLHPCLCLYHAP